MQHAATLHGVSFRQDPRDGQRRVFDAAASEHKRFLNIELPTGYGKTFTAAGVYSIRQHNFGVNRLLFITPTDAQHEQFCRDGHLDLASAGVKGPDKIVDVRFFGVQALKRHRGNEAQVFAITVQSMITKDGMSLVKELMATGSWMIAVDEYHHYGIGKKWGDSVRALNADFLLAMSATPHRPDEDSAFGKPDISVNYRSAAEEQAVKPLVGHSYVFRIDAIDDNGDVMSMTTTELTEAAGGDSPEMIEKFRIERKMRWSPKYVSPLVTVPIERMLHERLKTGYKLQALVGAMSVSHAELVCDQIKALFPELKADWVGTGTNGRPRDVNKSILDKFCPPKNADGKRPDPHLDVLVHVGIAGEGLDCRNVSEVIHLNSASLNNSNNQENGRAARFLPGIVGNINFDSSSEYAEKGYVGAAIMDAMSFQPPAPDTSDDKPDVERSSDIPPLPEEPAIVIYNLELERIDSGSPEVQRWAKALEASGVTGIDYRALKDNELEMDKVLATYRAMRQHEADQHNERAVVEQWQTSVEEALSVLTGRVVRLMTRPGVRSEKTLTGDVKKRINIKKKSDCGPVVKDVDTLKRHYNWLVRLDKEIVAKGLPSWLW